MRYSKLSDEQKRRLIASYLNAKRLTNDQLHAIAIAASDVLGHSGTRRGQDIQADRFAAALTYLVWSGYVRLKNDPRMPYNDYSPVEIYDDCGHGNKREDCPACAAELIATKADRK